MLGLVAQADLRGAAGAAPVCCCATPVGGAGECMGVRAAVLRRVLVFAVGTAGSGVVAGATGAVVGVRAFIEYLITLGHLLRTKCLCTYNL